MAPVFVEFDFGSDAYQQACQLRHEVLRVPLGLSLYEEDLSAESAQRHFGLWDGTLLLACVTAAPLSPNTAKLRQMAVSPGCQGQGHGRKLIRFVETQLAYAGVAKISLHARLTAVGFYEKLAYRTLGAEFTEVSLPHLRMEKSLKSGQPEE